MFSAQSVLPRTIEKKKLHLNPTDDDEHELISIEYQKNHKTNLETRMAF